MSICIDYFKSKVLVPTIADSIPYWHEIIPHNYFISAPAGCNLIHWGLRDNGI